MSYRTGNLRPAGRTVCPPADVRICLNEEVADTYIYVRTGILTHVLSNLSATIVRPFRIVLVGNQICRIGVAVHCISAPHMAHSERSVLYGRWAERPLSRRFTCDSGLTGRPLIARRTGCSGRAVNSTDRQVRSLRSAAGFAAQACGIITL